MAADIITTLQTFTDTTQTQTLIPASQTAESQAEPGLFASLVSECMDAEVLPGLLVPEAQPEEQALTFTGNNTFSQPVLELLAGTPEQPEDILPQPEVPVPDDDAVTWPEETETPEQPDIQQAFRDIKDFALSRLAEVEIPVQDIAEEIITDDVLAKIPDELRTEIGQVISDVADVLKQEDGSTPQPVMSMLSAISERIAVPESEPQDLTLQEEQDDQEDSLDVDETPEVTEEGAEFAGLAVAPNIQAQTVQAETPDTESQPDVLDAPSRQVRQPRETRPVQPEAETAPEDSQEAPDTQNSRTNFREVLENRNSGSETPEQENSPDGQAQNQSQSQGFMDRRDSSTRSRRIEPRTQSERSTEQQPANRRTESRSDFASFFEGVLSNRRTASRTPAQPLELRGTENFTQAAAIRDGITNVVRFIRADGMQKARVVVDPPALGRISVELTSGTSGVEASIKVSSEQIRQLVQDQLSQLRMNLSQQGVQVAEFTVDVQQDNSGQQHNQQQEQAMLNFGGMTEDDETEEFRVDLEEGLLYWVA